ncbi:MAG: hypothetical protein ACLSHL_09330 [Alistipes communis]
MPTWRACINRRDSVSQLSAHIVANAGGRSLDDLNGRIQVTGARYRYNDKEIEATNMTVTGENSERSKLVELHSIRRCHVPLQNQLSYGVRIPAPERVEIPADAERSPA